MEATKLFLSQVSFRVNFKLSFLYNYFRKYFSILMKILTYFCLNLKLKKVRLYHLFRYPRYSKFLNFSFILIIRSNFQNQVCSISILILQEIQLSE
jgi:hypothetical protein